MGKYDALAYDPMYAEMMKKWLAENNQGLPQSALSSPTPTNAMLTGNNSPIMNIPQQQKTGLDPWSIGMAAGSATAPIGASLLGRRREYPSGGGGAPSLGMTRGAEVPNAYGGRTNPVISMLLARFLGRRG